MKRTISAALAIVMILSMLLLTACSDENKDVSNSKYIGSWKASKVALKGNSEALDEEWALTLNGDGTGEFIDSEGSTKITWVLTKNGFKTKGDTKLTFTDDGDNIKTKLLNADIIFERQ